ncbi:CHASE3 domain-containing protein [Solirubrobacter ginsenosidimutans]|uniref:histidine kinase n=1 Tax=Solirubrobacter ginsenosidimutans TaxID=490573 RepID=A0A9X3N1Q3_9ACTN|nr:ATP-binding protein [Solirubrobacter ginsenosidimutans]MDA0166765.1 CHASE3 domain-containing protein [Solirubrobacter ginsenosidimutans]
MSARRRLTASQSFAIAVALLVVVGVLGTVASLIALSNLNDARVQLTDRLSPAVISASDFRSALIDQETGVRGYALTGDPTYLDPYESGLRDEARARAELDRLSKQPGLEQFREDIARIFAAARGWQEGYALPTIALVKSDPQQARTPQATGAGKARFDGLRRAVTDFQTRLAPVRAEARDTLDRNANYVLFWVLGTGIVILISVGAVAWVLRGTLVVPLQRLAGAVRGVARGDFEREVRGSGAREVVDLADDVDDMRTRIVSELEALRVAESDLRRSNAELEQFAYVASHDLQEPLRKVASFCQLLQQRYEGQLDARADQYIGFAVDGATRMQDLINDLLAFSRVGRMEQPHTDVDCAAVMTRVRADLGRVIEENEAELIVGELPTVRGDAGLLRVVFQNLCANAIKFRGEAPPVVHVDAEPEEAFWRFRVADNGIGIDPEYAERIFVLFQRLHPRTQYEGTGIGLAMCRKIVEYHGGRMWLDTERAGDTQGSTFYFTLPMDPETR